MSVSCAVGLCNPPLILSCASPSQATDLRLLMQYYREWACSLFPRLPFNALVEKIEKMGGNKKVMVSGSSLHVCIPGVIVGALSTFLCASETKVSRAVSLLLLPFFAVCLSVVAAFSLLLPRER